MKHTKTVVVPETTKVVTDKITCDFIGIEISRCGNKVDNVEISRETGYRSHGSGYGETRCVDMCGNCFETKLTPWMFSQFGVKPREEEWDF